MLKYKAMNIAVDLTQIPAHKTGIGIYALNLVREILRLNDAIDGFTFYFFSQDDDDEWKKLIKESGRSRLVTIKSRFFRKLILRFFFEQILLPRKCRQLNIDAVFSFHYTMPYLTRIKRIVTIPDMTFYLLPRMHRKIKRLYFKTLIPLSLKKSHKAVTISESSKNDILKRFKHIPADKIEVIHLGVNMNNPANPPADPLSRYGLTEKKYFLYMGTLEPRKNIPGIIQAFNHVVSIDESYKNNYKLVIAGQKGWFYKKIFAAVKKYHLENSVVFTGYINEAVKQPLLANAFVFLYPSFYEGFGLPVLEAMAWGVPVITANVSSLPEIAGDAALLIDPHQWQEIAEAMRRLLTEPSLYDRLAKKSREQAKTFSWQKTAEKTLELFDSLRNNEE
jgi:glycosyltransferase involved in cell wall biosynthesis